ncbi:metallophosphoesterase 1-like isoform X2 [Hyposmocoma kahamanoa]|uniref:metallophosphoesterase 1-like isoform X2 n=1 Tax=Hyposmocoma kahamanoa TaxID=1477025 RepID=UPI000E6DA372|nr:metallophosphoesterase 1-like isoform X2 [Hyposmocoma kahamanoa]
MRRVTRKIVIFVFGIALIVIYCEFLIYYVVIAQCGWWPLPNSSGPVLKALFLSDTHLLGSYRDSLFIKIRREWQMYRAFHAIIDLHYPDVVFVLGDLFDDYQQTDEQFLKDVQRYMQLFELPQDIKMHVVPGNHDIGFHPKMGYENGPQRFRKMFNVSTVQFLTIKDSHFVLLNSMAMEGDNCSLCLEARIEIDKISENQDQCQTQDQTPKLKYSRPILLQHFPLYRLSDEPCTEPDSAPSWEKKIKFKLKKDVLSKEATDYLVSKLKPRAAIGGHTHHGCRLHHKYSDADFWEISVPSFSWTNRPDPKYMLLSISPDAYTIHKCGLPSEITIAITAATFLFLLIYYINRRTIRMIS